MENLSILNSPFASCMKWFFSRLAVACTAKTKYAFKMHNVSLFDRLNWNSAFNELYRTQHSQTVQASIGEADAMARRGHIWFFFLCRYNTCRLKLWASLAEKSCYCVVAIVTLGKRSKQKAKFISATTRYSFYFILVLLSGGATSQANDE